MKKTKRAGRPPVLDGPTERVTITFNGDILHRVKIQAAKEGTIPSVIIDRALRSELKQVERDR